MRTVARHPIDSDQVRIRLEVLDAGTDRLVETASEHSVGLASLADHLLMLGSLRCALDPHADAPTTRGYFVAAANAYAEYFAAATNGKLDSHSYSKAGNWLQALWLGVLVRDKERTWQLADVPQAVLRASGTKYDQFIYDWVDSLQKFFHADPALEETFIETMNGTDPDIVTIASSEVLLGLLYPPIEMFYFMLRRDQERFNDSLERALINHRRYWTVNGRATNSDGMVALAPLAISVLAKQVGIPIQVTSDYLPEGLLDG